MAFRFADEKGEIGLLHIDCLGLGRRNLCLEMKQEQLSR